MISNIYHVASFFSPQYVAGKFCTKKAGKVKILVIKGRNLVKKKKNEVQQTGKTYLENESKGKRISKENREERKEHEKLRGKKGKGKKRQSKCHSKEGKG